MNSFDHHSSTGQHPSEGWGRRLFIALAVLVSTALINAAVAFGLQLTLCTTAGGTVPVCMGAQDPVPTPTQPGHDDGETVDEPDGADDANDISIGGSTA